MESAFTQARQRRGSAPLRQLFQESARPMATHQTVGAFYRGWRLMGLDSTILDWPDNARAFGRPLAPRRARGEIGWLNITPGAGSSHAKANSTDFGILIKYS